MQFAWIILPRSVTIRALQTALATLDRRVAVGGPTSTQMRVEASALLEPDGRIEIDDGGLEDIDQDELDRIHAVVGDPVYYRYRYHGRDVATEVLKVIAGSRLADGPMLITDGEGWYGTGREFLQRLAQDPEWWDWWRRDA